MSKAFSTSPYLVFKYVNKRPISIGLRNKSSLGLWDKKIDTEINQNIERYWSKDVLTLNKTVENYTHYILPMFPYPSGNLHMGHVRVYSISDTIARFYSLKGYRVIHPIGWDSFGLPAENAAILNKVSPSEWTKLNIASMKKQLQQIGFDFTWDREISTCDPEYYKWTQFIFLKLFENGLAYQSESLVNWDPIDKTVLADEQVDELGCSWRSGAKVEKKALTQWFIKTTKFSKQLYDGLNSDELNNWRDIIDIQKHWIGECDGSVVTFQIKLSNNSKSFDVWTSQPHKFIHGKFITISHNSLIAQEIKKNNLQNINAYNPITDNELPVYITDKVDYPEGRDVYIASPDTDEQDISIVELLNLVNEPKVVNINVEAENKRAIDIAKSKNVGGYFVSSKLRDWLISRQRFWGTPIPLIYCDKCGTVPVPYEELPLKLPKLQQSTTEIQSLKEYSVWVNCTCPKCKSPAKRETDTMDTFVDSSWYYYRFLDPFNTKLPFDKEKIKNLIPVNLYIGGKEHAALHLYYARFISYFLHSIGLSTSEEPFKKLLVQGMVMGQSYKIKSSGKYVPANEVEKLENKFVEKSTGELVLTQWEKMSKSKYNGVSPESVLAEFGCDMTRLLILANVSPPSSRNWSDETFPGVINWQRRMWRTMKEFLEHRNNESLYTSQTLSDDAFKNHEEKLWQARNGFVSHVTFHYSHTHSLSVAISRLQSLTSTLRAPFPPEFIVKSREYELCLATLIILLAPMAPHFSSELWAGLQSAPNRVAQQSNEIQWDKMVLEQRWPTIESSFELPLKCMLDGSTKCKLSVRASDLPDLTQEKALQLVLKEKAIAKFVNKKRIHKIHYELYPGYAAILNICSEEALHKPVKQKSTN